MKENDKNNKKPCKEHLPLVCLNVPWTLWTVSCANSRAKCCCYRNKFD